MFQVTRAFYILFQFGISSMHIGLLGGSGRTGKQVIFEALRHGYRITTLARNASKLDTTIINKCTIIQGDATNVKDISLVLKAGIDVLIHTVSVPFFHRNPTSLYSRVTGAVIAAWGEETHSCFHYLVMSSFGTHHGRKLPFPFNIGYRYFLGDVADDKEKEEHLLSRSCLPRTVIKAVLLNNASTTFYKKTPFASFVPSVRQKISRTAVAHALLDIAGNTNTIGSKIVVSSH